MFTIPYTDDSIFNLGDSVSVYIFSALRLKSYKPTNIELLKYDCAEQ